MERRTLRRTSQSPNIKENFINKQCGNNPCAVVQLFNTNQKEKKLDDYDIFMLILSSVRKHIKI